MRQLFYYKMRQKFITKYVDFIAKCDSTTYHTGNTLHFQKCDVNNYNEI